MTVTAHVTRDSERTSSVTHSPITRSDPPRTDPALLQLHVYSPFHHCVASVTRETAPRRRFQPLTTRDEMMKRGAVHRVGPTPHARSQTALTAGGIQ